MPDNDDARPRATLLLTRPRAASERFADAVTQRGLPLDVVIAPLMEIVPQAAPAIPDDTALIFTSTNAIPAAGAGKGRRAWCVGPRTTQAAREAGFDAVLAGACGDELVARLLQDRPTTPLLHLSGRHRRGDIVDRLHRAGLKVTGQVVYDQVDVRPPAAFAATLARTPLIVPLFSPRSAALFAQAGESWRPKHGDVLVALSGAVASALPPGWAEKTVVTTRPDGPSMIDEIARRISPSGENGGVTR